MLWKDVIHVVLLLLAVLDSLTDQYLWFSVSSLSLSLSLSLSPLMSIFVSVEARLRGVNR